MRRDDGLQGARGSGRYAPGRTRSAPCLHGPEQRAGAGRRPAGPPGFPQAEALTLGPWAPTLPLPHPHGRQLWQVVPTGQCWCAENQADTTPLCSRCPPWHCGHERQSVVHAVPGPGPGALPSQTPARQSPPASPHCPGAGPMPADTPEPRLAQGLPGQRGPGHPCDSSPSGLPAQGGWPGGPGPAGGAGSGRRGQQLHLQRAEARRALTCRDPGSSHRSPGLRLNRLIQDLQGRATGSKSAGKSFRRRSRIQARSYWPLGPPHPAVVIGAQMESEGLLGLWSKQ